MTGFPVRYEHSQNEPGHARSGMPRFSFVYAASGRKAMLR